MGIRKISLGLAAVALLGVSPVMAAAPVMPSVAKLSAPAAGTNLAIGARAGVAHGKKSSNIAGAAVVVAVLAGAAVAGGVVAATDEGHNPVSP